MHTRVQLSEFERINLALDDSDQRMIRSDLAGKIGITPTVDRTVVELNPNQFVGVVRLPSGITLDLLPKVPLFNVMWMIAEVERLEGIDFTLLEQQANIATFDDILEPIARVFVDMVERLIDRGLYRAYVEEEDNLSAIRGRIDFQQDVSRNVVLRHRTYCRFTEFSWDIPENQVIRQVVRLLAGWGFSTRLSGRLMALDRQMEDVRRTDLRSDDIDRFAYSRQSEHYRPIHRFCRLFLQGFSLSEQVGESPFDGFLMDMNILFERFITLRVRAALQQKNPRLRLLSQSTHALDTANVMRIKPDLLLEDRGQYQLVGDTKYKRKTRDPNDMYQMIAYCTVLGLPKALLIYPRHLADLDQYLEVRRAGIVVQEVSIDLRESRHAIASAIDGLADLMIAAGVESTVE